MIPYGKQEISQDDIESVIQVLKSDFLTQGPQVPIFQDSIAAHCGAEYAIAVNSATSALHIACMALGVGPGDSVWTSPNTFVASANCALYCGANIDFVDIDSRSYNISLEALAIKLENAKKNACLPKVVVPVHFAGQPCEMQAIWNLAQKYGFKIIEDASHAIGASYGEYKVGSCTYSDITVFSFHPVKIITTAEGGMALTNNSELANRMYMYRSHGITSDAKFMEPRPSNEIWNYQQISIGYNYRMTDLQAALGLSQFKSLEKFINRRHQIAKKYDAAFYDLPVLTPLQKSEYRSSYHLYPIRIRESLCGKTQRQIYNFFLEAKIWVNIHYIPVYRQPYYEKLGFVSGYCKEAETFHKEVISLPIYSSLTDLEQDYVINVLRESLK